MNKKTKVTLRWKDAKKGKSFYLDFYPAILINGKKSRRKFLGIYTSLNFEHTDLRKNSTDDNSMFREALSQRDIWQDYADKLLSGSVVQMEHSFDINRLHEREVSAIELSEIKVDLENYIEEIMEKFNLFCQANNLFLNGGEIEKWDASEGSDNEFRFSLNLM